MRLLHRVKRSMSDSDLVALGLALPISLMIVCWFSLTLGSETVPATCSSAVLEDLLLLCLVSEIDRFTFGSLWLASLLVTWFAYWYSEALPMRIIPIKTFRAVRLNNSGWDNKPPCYFGLSLTNDHAYHKNITIRKRIPLAPGNFTDWLKLFHTYITEQDT